jgi:cation transport ATPase
VLIEPSLESVLALRSIATAYADRQRGSFATALVPNVACVIGALYFGVPILGVVALTNAGTLASYLQGQRAMRAADRVPITG